ncbi:MAG: glutathione peroxidase [Bdellovibrionales bacterium]
MKHMILGLVLFSFSAAYAEKKGAQKMETPKSVYDFKVKDITGKDVDLKAYKGKVALVVNTASKCGYTPQYKGLQALYDQYKDKNFVVLGFPSNDFGGQEPGTQKEIKSFCELNYGVNFPLFDKGPVKGSDKSALYVYLTESQDHSFTGDVEWNFEKFLIDRQGRVIGRYKSKVKPDSEELKEAIKKAL